MLLSSSSGFLGWGFAGVVQPEPGTGGRCRESLLILLKCHLLGGGSPGFVSGSLAPRDCIGLEHFTFAGSFWCSSSGVSSGCRRARCGHSKSRRWNLVGPWWCAGPLLAAFGPVSGLLFALCPWTPPPKHRHLTAGCLHSEPLSPQPYACSSWETEAGGSGR